MVITSLLFLAPRGGVNNLDGQAYEMILFYYITPPLPDDNHVCAPVFDVCLRVWKSA